MQLRCVSRAMAWLPWKEQVQVTRAQPPPMRATHRQEQVRKCYPSRSVCQGRRQSTQIDTKYVLGGTLNMQASSSRATMGCFAWPGRSWGSLGKHAQPSHCFYPRSPGSKLKSGKSGPLMFKS